MTLPKHHPSDALLLAYAAGGLDEGQSLAVATHIQLCPSCRRRLRQLEALGGAILEDLPPEPVSDAALRRTLAHLDDPPPVAAAPSALDDDGLDLPAPLRAYTRALGTTRWRTIAPGMRQIEVRRNDGKGGAVRLLRLAPGVAVPQHGHTGTELTLILHGSYSDRIGRFGPGDLAEVDGTDDDHSPVVDSDEDCVCLIVTEAPLRFRGFLPRLVQPLIGI